ncbi:heterokaryon incompatibility protein-domain-containing protein [Xylaria arbuscula]|nr:heterokaryon incompatibility protein-domain-containing protein [Xylaria arbuscula]
MNGEQVDQSLWETLPDPRRYIRLLEIHSASTGPIQCELSMWRIDLAPSYDAISYTWGDPKSVSFVEVNGRNMQVRENCDYVLRQVYKYHRYYWIDTLCINQANNYEKSFQVAMMGEIYRSAERVLVCVGRHENDSAFFFNILNKYSHLFVWASKTYPDFDDTRVGVEDRSRKSSRAVLKWKLTQPFATKNRLLAAFVKFQKRPYFLRVWTYQEVFLAKKIVVRCGEDRCLGETLHGFFMAIIRDHENTSLGNLTASISEKLEKLRLSELPVLRRLIPWDLYDTGQNVPMFLRYRTTNLIPDHLIALGSPHLISLWQAIRTASGLECYDPRDKLYGFLSIVDWTGMQRPQPDYTHDVFDIALDALRLCALCIQQKLDTELHEDNFAYAFDRARLMKDRALEVAELIIDTFKLTKQSNTKFSASIQQRQSIQPHIFAPAAELGTIDRSLFRYRDVGKWPGYKLKLVYNEVGQAERLRLRHPRLNLTFNYHNGIMHGPQGRLRAVLPSSTRSEDWLLLNGSRSLVIRPRPDHRFDLIGQAAWDNSHSVTKEMFHRREDDFTDESTNEATIRSTDESTDESSDESIEDIEVGEFRIYFNLEDLLALAHIPSSPGEWFSHRSAQVGNGLLHFRPGLSYAQRLRNQDFPLFGAIGDSTDTLSDFSAESTESAAPQRDTGRRNAQQVRNYIMQYS